MKFKHPQAFIWVPPGISSEEALKRTTHLSIGAHPDDLEFMSFHGIESCYESKDSFYTGIVVTDGAKSVKAGPYQNMSPEQMARVRIEEQLKAAKLGKYNALIMLQYSSADLLSSSKGVRPWIQEIKKIFSYCNPHTLYSHNPFDKHPSHLAVILPLLQLLQKLEPKRKPKKFYACEVWRGLDWVLEQDRIALALGKPALSKKINLLFQSQIDAGKNYAEAVKGRRIANATFSNPHETDAASQIELALDLTSLMHRTRDQIFPYLKAILSRFEKDLTKNIQRYL